jgi:hydrogenase maturation protease
MREMNNEQWGGLFLFIVSFFIVHFLLQIMKRTFVGGVGYHFMRDLSIGPVLTDRLAAMEWPDHVKVDADFSYGPISIVQRFKSEPDQCDRIVLFAAMERDLPPGTITAYRWEGKLPPDEEIQERINESVTGVVSLDNLLVVGEQFKIWPDELFVVEMEPEDINWGDGFSPTVAAVVDEMLATIRRVTLEEEFGH